jgi:hypothetical protein
MRWLARWNTLGVDIVAGGMVTVCALASLWFSILGEKRAPRILVELADSVEDARTQIRRVSTQLEQQRRLLAQRRDQLAQQGRLPDEAPIDEYFHILSRLAADCHLQVRGQSPLSPRTYPGLLEQRYSFEVAGTWPNVARFLKHVEQTEYWADVSYFKIEGLRGGALPDADLRSAQLTFSVFSAMPMSEPPKVEKG